MWRPGREVCRSESMVVCSIVDAYGWSSVHRDIRRVNASCESASTCVPDLKHRPGSRGPGGTSESSTRNVILAISTSGQAFGTATPTI